MEGHQLAVDVGRVHRVGVGDGHASHARPGDHLRGIGPHAAQPDHEHVGVAQQLQFFAAEQQFGSFQPVMRMRFHLSLSFVALRPARSFVLAACEYSFVII